MLASNDAFDRAVEREKVLTARAGVFYSPSAQMKLVQRFFAAIFLGWAAVVAAHWIWLSDPRWLVVLHTVVFAVSTLYATAASIFVSMMRRRQAAYLGDEN